MSFLDYIATIPIPKLENVTTNYDEKLGFVAGWGKTSDTDATTSNVLRSISVTIIPTLICELSYLFSLTFDQMCTTGVEQKNICLGDSGSPLVVDGYQVKIEFATIKADTFTSFRLELLRMVVALDVKWVYQASTQE